MLKKKGFKSGLLNSKLLVLPLISAKILEKTGKSAKKGNNDNQMSRMGSRWGTNDYSSTSQPGEQMTWGKWQAYKIRYGPGVADSDLMFAVTSNTMTRGHNLEQISKYKTKQEKSDGWAINQLKLAVRTTDALLRMQKIYVGSKGDWTNTWRRYLLTVIIQAETIPRKSLSRR